MFDEVSCEEFYGEDEDRRAWMDELEIDWVNGELQLIADEGRVFEIDLQWEELIGMQFLCSDFEASHVGV